MGIQSGSIKGYGCQCEDFETYIGIKYEHVSRSVSFCAYLFFFNYFLY